MICATLLAMRANWQECRYYPATRAGWVALYVTLNRKGDFHLSGPTYSKMGEPKAVQIFFDSANNRFGLKQAALGARNAFPVCKRGPRGGRRIFVAAVLKEFRIDIPETIQFFDADFDDEGILVLDLRTARVLNHWTKRAKPASGF